MSELSRENEREQQQDLYNNIRDIQDSILVEDDQLTIARSAHDRIMTRKLQRDDEMTAMKEKISLIEIEIFESISSKKNQELEFQQLTNVLNDVKRSIDHDEGVLIISLEHSCVNSQSIMHVSIDSSTGLNRPGVSLQDHGVVSDPTPSRSIETSDRNTVRQTRTRQAIQHEERSRFFPSIPD